MSDIAKDRLLAVGARFASYEHANKDTSNDQQLESGTMNPNAPTLSSGGGSKMSFWKKNSGKVPGRYETYITIIVTKNNILTTLLHLSN